MVLRRRGRGNARHYEERLRRIVQLVTLRNERARRQTFRDIPRGKLRGTPTEARHHAVTFQGVTGRNKGDTRKIRLTLPARKELKHAVNNRGRPY